MDGLIWFLAWRLLSTSPTLCLMKFLYYIYRNKGTFLWNFVLNSGLRKLHCGISIAKTCYELSSRGERSKRDQLDHRQSAKLIIPSMINCFFITAIIKLCL